MSEEIWKFPFDLEGEFEVIMPASARILHVELQERTPCIWALVNTSHDPQVKRFKVVGTGHALPFDRAWTYIATFQQPPYVWHLFEIVGELEAA